MQRRRVHAISATLGAGGVLNLIATIDETNGVNAHGLRGSIAIEPQDGGANGNGIWNLWCIPDESSTVPNGSFATMEAEGSNAFLWATGTFVVSNETPFNHDVAIGTSRNCQRGARLILQISLAGLTAGVARTNLLMTYFTKSL